MNIDYVHVRDGYSRVKRFSPKISVIVPVYNTAPWLARCLDSICAQTYQNLEILCVNDGSTDNSAEILAEYAAKDGRIKVFTQENAGLSAARNTALNHATGEWVTGVDSDDWLELDAYSRAVQHISPDVDLVVFGINVVGDDAYMADAGLVEYCRVKSAGVQEVSFATYRGLNVYFWNKLYRRSLIQRYGLRFPVGLRYEDMPFLYSYLCMASVIACVPLPLYNYWQRPDSIMGQTSRRDARGVDHLRVVENVHDFYVKNGVLKKMQSVFDWIFAAYYHKTLETTPEDMHAEVHRMAHDLALRSGSIQNVRYGMIRDLRQRTMGRLERMFHWYVDNRECYGVGGHAIYSVTYEDGRTVHRLLGREVKTVLDEEPS